MQAQSGVVIKFDSKCVNFDGIPSKTHFDAFYRSFEVFQSNHVSRDWMLVEEIFKKNIVRIMVDEKMVRERAI